MDIQLYRHSYFEWGFAFGYVSNKLNVSKSTAYMLIFNIGVNDEVELSV